MSSLDLTDLKADLFELEQELAADAAETAAAASTGQPALPPRPAAAAAAIGGGGVAGRSTGGGVGSARRLSTARSRYESSVREAVRTAMEQDSAGGGNRHPAHVRSHSGWLEKQGGMRKNWKRRWFSFHPMSSTLSYFEDQTCRNKKGELRLLGTANTRRYQQQRDIVRYNGRGGPSASAVLDSRSFSVFCEGRELKCRAATADEAVTWCAVLDNEFFFSELRSEVDKRISVLRDGQVFQKHGRKGAPHSRFVWLTADETRVCWAKAEAADGSDSQTRKVQKDALVYVEKIKAVERGRKTKVFQRQSDGGKAPDALCFSLVAEDRTLDIVAPDVATAELWISAISYLSLFAHAARERATLTGRWRRSTTGIPSMGASAGSELYGATEGGARGGAHGRVEVPQLAARNVQNKLAGRGEKIDRMQNQSASLASSASSFAELAEQLARQKKSSWF